MITTVTLNASIDKAYRMKGELRGGTVMRVAENHDTAGGKGLNVARVARICGAEVLATGLAGGYNGAYLESLLDADGIAHDFARIGGETRCCLNILGGGYVSTELLEPGPEVTEAEFEAFLEKLAGIAAQSSVVCVSGSVPRGLAEDACARVVELCREAGARVILDTSGNQLARGMKACPTMVKPNGEELEAIYQTELVTRSDVADLARRIHREGVELVVVSLGGDGALLVCGDGVFQAQPPKVDVVNTVGCGDSMVAAFAVALERAMAPAQALRYAVSVATANALSPSTGSFDPAAQEEIFPQVTLREL